MDPRLLAANPARELLKGLKNISTTVSTVRRQLARELTHVNKKSRLELQRSESNRIKRQVSNALADIDRCVWLLGCELGPQDALVLCKCLEETANQIDRLFDQTGLAAPSDPCHESNGDA